MSTHLIAAAVLVQSSSDDGLTFREVLGQLPTDPASLFTLAFLIGSFALVVWAGRPKDGGGGGRPRT